GVGVSVKKKKKMNYSTAICVDTEKRMTCCSLFAIYIITSDLSFDFLLSRVVHRRYFICVVLRRRDLPLST
ncbi:hypothetical protein, partial [Burkholderia sp. Ac-20345]|uniref:hypothetical protein n=1 Tax=Burkholderia sp. Ac-20345 TaxID=2703891 RepID=UPI00197BF395